ncbi:MAG: hypothetical protein LBG13_00205 [Holosporales bacterium]|jgi:hypothetical protein|nr:hypothetical protein [Holosporales bacterium]
MASVVACMVACGGNSIVIGADGGGTVLKEWTDELKGTLASVISGDIVKGAESTLIRIESTSKAISERIEWIEKSMTENQSMRMVSKLCEKQREANVVRARADAEFQKAKRAYNGLKSLSVQALPSFLSIAKSPLLNIVKNAHEQEKKLNDIMDGMSAIERECDKASDEFIVESSVVYNQSVFQSLADKQILLGSGSANVQTRSSAFRPERYKEMMVRTSVSPGPVVTTSQFYAQDRNSIMETSGGSSSSSCVFTSGETVINVRETSKADHSKVKEDLHKELRVEFDVRLKEEQERSKKREEDMMKVLEKALEEERKRYEKELADIKRLLVQLQPNKHIENVPEDKKDS